MMDRFIKENGTKKDKDMDEENVCFQMVIILMEIGKMVFQVQLVDLLKKMETCLKDKLKMDNQMDEE